MELCETKEWGHATFGVRHIHSGLFDSDIRSLVAFFSSSFCLLLSHLSIPRLDGIAVPAERDFINLRELYRRRAW